MKKNVKILVWTSFLALISALGEREKLADDYSLPSWITSNPAYGRPEKINAVESGEGAIAAKKDPQSWRVTLNEKLGHGVEVSLNELVLGTDSDYLLVGPEPEEGKSFREFKIFVGTSEKTQKLRIPNTKNLFVLFAASGSETSKFSLSFQRYGTSYEMVNPTTENPVIRDSVYEVHLKGKNLKEFLDSDFIKKIKDAIRETAKKFCLLNKIPFNSDISLDEMVTIKRISFCPLEWPDRDICVSLLNSVYVSGIKMTEDKSRLFNYELTAEHLKEMWTEMPHRELLELGLEVFKLPETFDTLLWWILIIGLILVFSILAALIFWRLKLSSTEVRRIGYNPEEIKPKNVRKKSKFKLSKHQKIPAFMYTTKGNEMNDILRRKTDSVQKEQPPPIKSYFGGLLFPKVNEEAELNNSVGENTKV